jgi:hypothetical protein
MLTDPDDEGVQELVAEAVNEVMLIASVETRHVGQIALRDIGLHVDLQPFTLRDAIKEAALALLVKEAPFFEPVDKKSGEGDRETEEEKARLVLAEEEKTQARQAAEAAKVEAAKKKAAEEAKEKEELKAQAKQQVEEEEKRADDEAENTAEDAEQAEAAVEVEDKHAKKTDGPGTHDDEADADNEDKDDTERNDDDRNEASDDTDTDTTDGKDEEEVIDGEFIDEVDLWIEKTLEEYRREQDTKQEGEEVIDGPQPISKEELGYLKHQARLFGVPMKQIKTMSPQMLKQRVIDTVEARVEMGGFYRPYSDQVMVRAIYSALTVNGEMDKRRLAEAIFVATHVTSDNLVYREPLNDNHLPSHLKQEGEKRLTAEENYAVLRAHLHSPNPHVRREARLALTRRAEWIGVSQHARRGIPAEAVRWGRDPSTFVHRAARRIKHELFGERPRNIAYDRWAARWARPARQAIRRRFRS